MNTPETHNGETTEVLNAVEGSERPEEAAETTVDGGNAAEAAKSANADMPEVASANAADAPEVTQPVNAVAPKSDTTAAMPAVQAAETAEAPGVEKGRAGATGRHRHSVPRVVASVCVAFIMLLFVGSSVVSAVTPEPLQNDFWIVSQKAHHEGLKNTDDIVIGSDIDTSNQDAVDELIDNPSDANSGSDNSESGTAPGESGGNDASDNQPPAVDNGNIDVPDNGSTDENENTDDSNENVNDENTNTPSEEPGNDNENEEVPDEGGEGLESQLS